MALYSIISLTLSFLVIGLGGFLLLSVYQGYSKSVYARTLFNLIGEGLSTFNKRTISIIAQLIVYGAILMIGGSFILHQNIEWQQLLSFALGTSLMSLISFLSLRLMPALLSKILARSQGFIQDGLTLIYDLSKALSFLMMGGILFVLVICLEFLGVRSIIGLGMGVLVSSFFLRLGGGVFSVSANAIAEMSSQLDNKAPKDQRNPAILLHVIGEYIGDLFGYGADIVSSYLFSVIAAILIAIVRIHLGSWEGTVWCAFPLWIMTMHLGVGALVYILGRIRLRTTFKNILLEGVYLSILLNSVFIVLIVRWLSMPVGPLYAYLLGTVSAVCIVLISEYSTNQKYGAARSLIQESQFGSIMPLMNSISMGLKVNGAFLLITFGSLFISYKSAGFYGVSLAAMGLLSVSISVVSAKNFAAISKGLAKIGKIEFIVGDVFPKNVGKYYALGKTVSVIGNGFAVAAAIFSTISLFFSLLLFADINTLAILQWPGRVLCGIGIGVPTVFFFLGFLLRGGTYCILLGIQEVFRQFKQIPYLLAGKTFPDIIKASDLHTVYALKALSVPGLILLFFPIIIHVSFGDEALFGLVLGVIVMGGVNGYFWASIGDFLRHTQETFASGRMGGETAPVYAYVMHAKVFGSSYNEILGPGSTMLMKGILIVSIGIHILGSN